MTSNLICPEALSADKMDHEGKVRRAVAVRDTALSTSVNRGQASKFATFILASVLFCGCHDDSSSHASVVDPAKVIDLGAPTLFAMRTTVFTFAEADNKGWPARAEHQEYVRFLQDRGIQVGFTRDHATNLHMAVVDASDLDKVVEADAAAKAEGVAKPPMVPTSSHGSE